MYMVYPGVDGINTVAGLSGPVSKIERHLYKVTLFAVNKCLDYFGFMSNQAQQNKRSSYFF